MERKGAVWKKLLLELIPLVLLGAATQIPGVVLENMYRYSGGDMTLAYGIEYLLTATTWMILVYYIAGRIVSVCRKI